MHDIQKNKNIKDFTKTQKGAIVLVESKKVKQNRNEALERAELIYFIKAIALIVFGVMVIIGLIFWT